MTPEKVNELFKKHCGATVGGDMDYLPFENGKAKDESYEYYLTLSEKEAEEMIKNSTNAAIYRMQQGKTHNKRFMETK